MKMNDDVKEKLSPIIDIPDHIKSPEELLRQDLTIIKGISKELAAKLKNVLKISTIEGLATRTLTEEEFRMLKFLGIDTFDLNVWLFVSKVIAENKIEKYLGPQKISIVGLNYAGKTAIWRIMKRKLNLDAFIEDKPTMGAEYDTFNKAGLQYSIVDMGGQNIYRKQYIQEAQKYFFNVLLLIYVIDVQDPDRFDESLNYFKDIIKVLKVLKEDPEILILINKVDPDIKNNEDIKKSISFLKFKLEDFLKEQEKLFKYEIQTFSIYESLGDNRTIISEIRNFATRGASKKVIHKFEEKYEKILNMFLEIRDEIDGRLSNIEKDIMNNRIRIEELQKSLDATIEVKPGPIDEGAQTMKIKSLQHTINEEIKTMIKNKEKAKTFTAKL